MSEKMRISPRGQGFLGERGEHCPEPANKVRDKRIKNWQEDKGKTRGSGVLTYS
jgi:hypothetical protein